VVDMARSSSSGGRDDESARSRAVAKNKRPRRARAEAGIERSRVGYDEVGLQRCEHGGVTECVSKRPRRCRWWSRPGVCSAFDRVLHIPYVQRDEEEDKQANDVHGGRVSAVSEVVRSSSKSRASVVDVPALDIASKAATTASEETVQRWRRTNGQGARAPRPGWRDLTTMRMRWDCRNVSTVE